MNDQQLTAFEKWWNDHGEYCRAGGGIYEKTFAFRAYEAALARREPVAEGEVAEALAQLRSYTVHNGAFRMCRYASDLLERTEAARLAAEELNKRYEALISGANQLTEIAQRRADKAEAQLTAERGQVRDNLAVAEAVRDAAMVALGDEKSHLVVAGHIKQLDLPAIIAAHLPDLEQQAKDAARYAWLRSQHEAQEVHSDTEGFSWSEPAACAFTVFRPTRDESLEPVGCFPGELDEAIDAAMKEQP